MSDNNPRSIGYTTLSEENMEPVYAMLCFYYDSPDSMARYKACNEALDVLLAVEDFERWLRNTIDSGRNPPAESIRDYLFSCFMDNGVTIPGWE